MIKTTFLNLKSDARRLPGKHSTVNLLTTVRIDEFASCAALYKEVGRACYWDIYRVGWSSADWQDYLDHPDIDIYALQHEGQPIGYLELKKHDGSLEIVNFGLRPQCIGRGLGRLALEKVIEHGFSSGTAELWLHTCSLDHPAALNNYLARGFRIMRESTDNFLALDPTVRGAHALA